MRHGASRRDMRARRGGTAARHARRRARRARAYGRAGRQHASASAGTAARARSAMPRAAYKVRKMRVARSAMKQTQRARAPRHTWRRALYATHARRQHAARRWFGEWPSATRRLPPLKACRRRQTRQPRAYGVVIEPPLRTTHMPPPSPATSNQASPVHVPQRRRVVRQRPPHATVKWLPRNVVETTPCWLLRRKR